MRTSVANTFEDVCTSETRIETKETKCASERPRRAIEALRLTGQQYDILEAIQLSQITLGMLDGESGITITGPDTGTGLIQAPSTPSSPSTRVSTTTTTTGPGGGGGG
jgi:hypothetical protein